MATSIMEQAALEELRATARPLSPEGRGQGQPVVTHPAALEAEYWYEGGAWAGHVSALGVSAVGDSEPELFAALGEAVEEYWDILNEKYATLSDELRAQLDLRYLGLTFVKRA